MASLPRYPCLIAGLLTMTGTGCSFSPTPTSSVRGADADPYLWLEEVDGERAMEWVEAHNRATLADLQSRPEYPELYRQALEVLDSASRLPVVTQRGAWLYNFWKDAAHPRGLYRRTTLEQLRQAEPTWETVLDLDALAAAEGRPWVFKGFDCLEPEYRRCLVRLSPGGGDAVEVREFDLEGLQFVADGFFLPRAKSQVAWIDEDRVFVATDFGPGSMTTSGYPRIVKIWTRGTPLAAAEVLYTAEVSSVWARARRLRTSEGDIDLVTDGTSFWTSRSFQLVDGRLEPLDLPSSAVIEDGFAGRLVISLKDDWQRGDQAFRAGQVILADPSALRGGDGGVEVLVDPTAGEVVEAVVASRQGVLVSMLEDVRGRLWRYEPTPTGGMQRRSIPFPDNGSLQVRTVDSSSGDFFVEYQSFTTPPTLYHVDGPNPRPELIRSQAPTFDGSRIEVGQHWATSDDGTKVPYFVVAPKGIALDGTNPTHIFSYGGFRNALTPSYSGSYEDLHGAYGKLWLERGGVFVLANIRGGGEFGPAWHQAALKEERLRSYEDFAAVARDLIERKVTSPRHLGIEGRSNGGLLVSVQLTRYPELYGAVVMGSPLADMRRYHRLLAGASWMAEYGDPDDPEQWAFISEYSPYQRLEAGRDYPALFLYLSTRDDRVHPAHARKFAARMEELGYPVWYWELTEGGHGASVTNAQLAQRLALAYTHLWRQLR